VRYATPEERQQHKAWERGFYNGVLVALQCIYEAGNNTTAEEIVVAVGAAGLLRTAKRDDDICLQKLRKTIRFLARRKPHAK